MICILTYCDTDDKKNQLSNLIGSLKEMYPKQKILVYSHYRNLEPSYYSKADYYIFDHTNPISKKHIIDWQIVYTHNKKFYKVVQDWGLAVLQMIRRSSLFVKSISNEGCLFLNYDINHTKIKDHDYISKFESGQKEHVALFSNWGVSKNSLSLTCFYLDLPNIKTEFFDKFNSEKYHSYPISLIPEDIFKLLVDEEFSGRYTVTDRIPTTVSGSSRALPKDNYLTKFFGAIFVSRNDSPNDKRKCLVTWDGKTLVEKIGVEFEGKQYELVNENGTNNKDKAFFSHLPDEFSSETISIISVNDEKIDMPYKIQGLDSFYFMCNYHQSL